MSDETADIAGKEHFIGIMLLKHLKWKAELLEIIVLEKLNVEAIASSIMQFTSRINLDKSKLVGLGFDGYSTIRGKKDCIQALIKKQYPIASFFYHTFH